MDGEELGGVVGHFFGGGGEVLGLVLEDFEAVHEVLAELPGGEAAVAPVGDVLLVYGLAVEGDFEHFLNCRNCIEPFEDGTGGVVAVEAFVEVLADEAGEFGDFGETGHGWLNC